MKRRSLAAASGDGTTTGFPQSGHTPLCPTSAVSTSSPWPQCGQTNWNVGAVTADSEEAAGGSGPGESETDESALADSGSVESIIAGSVSDGLAASSLESVESAGWVSAEETATAGAGVVLGAPQKMQNRMPAGTGLPHAGQHAVGEGAQTVGGRSSLCAGSEAEPCGGTWIAW